MTSYEIVQDLSEKNYQPYSAFKTMTCSEACLNYFWSVGLDKDKRNGIPVQAAIFLKAY